MSNQKWISVKERLPDKMQYVLVNSKSYGINSVCCILYGFKSGERWLNPTKEWEVTHWQPMPAPYTEQEAEKA